MSMKLNKSTAGLIAPDNGSIGILSGGEAANANAIIVVGFAEIEVWGKKPFNDGNGYWLIDTVEKFNQALDAGASPASADFDNTAHSFGDLGYGVNPDHTTVNLADWEDVYFVSKSGQEETVRYFFVEDAVVAPHILPGHHPEALKLEDVSDVPAFTQADAGKILSVDAQGNLAWITR
jgi:hypothetical protein